MLYSVDIFMRLALFQKETEEKWIGVRRGNGGLKEMEEWKTAAVKYYMNRIKIFY